MSNDAVPLEVKLPSSGYNAQNAQPAPLNSDVRHSEVALTDQGTQYKFAGNLEEAMRKYLQAIAVNPRYAPAYYNIGVLFSELGRPHDALPYYKAALQYNPFYVEAYCNIGVLYKSMERVDEAITQYLKALSLNPNYIIARNNLAIALTDYGTQLKQKGQVQEGIRQYKKALVYNPQYADAHYNLGVAYGEVGKVERAIVSYELAVRFNPHMFQAYNNLGVLYKDTDNTERAVQCYRMALHINPKFSQTLNNLGVIYTLEGKFEEAYAHIRAALEVNPQYAEAYNNLGVLYRDEGKIEQAVACYDQCLALQPLSRNAGQNKLLALNFLPDADPAGVADAHRQWGVLFQALFRPFDAPSLRPPDPVRPLRIGYISPDFFTHSVSYFIEAVLAHHDRSLFAVVCYANVAREDHKTAVLRGLADQWRSVVRMSTADAAAMVHADGIDILVDLAGHTAGNRLDILAMKPAPVQVSFIGYPNTTGLAAVDYRITDALADPEDTAQPFSETLVRLPGCFLCYTPPPDAPDVAPLPAVANGYVTFGSFNSLSKINERVRAVWARILRAVPQARLVVKAKPFLSKAVAAEFVGSFARHGIDGRRITALPLQPHTRDHLACYGLMDLSLDTFPYAGTTTTCEALWMGVPVVALRGRVHAQNVAVSLLTAVGRPEWIADSVDDYVDTAIRLADDIPRLAAIRAELRAAMKNSRLCQGEGYTRALEKAYRDMWRRWCNTQKKQETR